MASATEEMETAFRNIDTNGDGRISESELESLLRSLGSDTSPAEVRRMMSEMDKDGDGFIDFKEFADFHRGTDLSVAGDELRAAFDVYDKDKNGLISAVELQAVLKCLGENATVMDCAAMIATVDADGDGHVNFEEFKTMMR